jgi:hypothetical protein
MIAPPSSKSRKKAVQEEVREEPQEEITIPTHNPFQVLTPEAEGVSVESAKASSYFSTRKASQHTRVHQGT